MKRGDALKELRRRRDYLARRTVELQTAGGKNSYERQEFWALEYAIAHIEENAPEPDERCRQIMANFQVKVMVALGSDVFDREQLEEDAAYLHRYSRSSFGGRQFKAGLIADFIRDSLLQNMR